MYNTNVLHQFLPKELSMRIHSRRSVLSGIFASALMCSGLMYGQATKDGPKHYVLGASEIVDIHSKVNNKDYALIINVPSSYAQNPSKKYPVFYFCDGYYDFALITMIYYDQLFDKTAPECILVGFSYKGEDLDYGKLRTYDLTPMKIMGADGTGGGADYLKIIEEEFIPYVESHYRADTGFRALGGSSLGGLFSIYAMLTKPSLFNAYISSSPAVSLDRGWLFLQEEQYHQQHKDLPVALYMTGAEKEFSDNPGFIESIKFFGSLLGKRKYENFRYQFRVLDDSYHASSKPEAYTRGMQFIFAPLMGK